MTIASQFATNGDKRTFCLLLWAVKPSNTVNLVILVNKLLNRRTQGCLMLPWRGSEQAQMAKTCEKVSLAFGRVKRDKSGRCKLGAKSSLAGSLNVRRPKVERAHRPGVLTGYLQ